MTFPRSRLAGATSIIALSGAGALLAPASEAQKYKTPKPVVLEMVQKGKTFSYEGPSKIARGQKLTFINRTKVQKGGPHTASVVDPSLLPRTKAEFKACGRDLEGLCGAIAFEGHKLKIEGERFTVRKPDTDVGKKGWDTAFGKKGDTWYSETLDESETRKVTAKAGTTLTFFCAIHPDMVKKLKVTK